MNSLGKAVGAVFLLTGVKQATADPSFFNLHNSEVLSRASEHERISG
jgi:hypothetical protein